MGTDRYEELVKKRDDVGLTDSEADELGRLEAERSGEVYGGADARAESEADAERADEEHLRERATSPSELVEEERYEDTVNEEGFPP